MLKLQPLPNAGGTVNVSRSVLISFGCSLAIVFSATQSVQAQQTPPAAAAQAANRGSVTGVVTEAATGQVLEQVNVRIVGTSFGTTTNAQGRYTIPNVTPGIIAVEATRIGFAASRKDDIRVAAGSPTTVDFTMSERALVLSSVVTTGVSDPIAGAKAPFSRSLVTAAQMPVSSTGDALAALQGKVAGATIRVGGAPGADLSIQLRSPTSFRGNTQPMIIVDGVIQLQDDPSLNSRGIPGADLDINPEDIASVEIVRGAAAAALYGQRAGSGVIVIKTNRGEGTPTGTTRITLGSEAGFSRLGKLVPLTNNHRFLVDENNQFIDLFGRPVEGRSFVTDPNQFIDNPWGRRTYDHVDQLFGTGTTLISNASIAQSSLSTNFNVQLGASNESGVLRAPSGGLERYNVRMNLDHRVGDKLSIALGTYYNRQFQRQIGSADTIFTQMYDIAPDIDLLAIDPETGGLIAFPDGENANRFNPLYGERSRDEWNRRVGLQTNIDIAYRPLSMLKLEGQFGYIRSDRNAQLQFLLPGELQSDGDADPGSFDIAADFDESFNGQFSAAILTAMGGWTFRTNAAILGTIIQNNGWEVRGDTLFQPQPDLDFARRYAADQVRRDQKTKSYSINAGTDYEGKYIFDALYRYDGNSLLPEDSRWQGNMRLSAAWSMAEESWWRFTDLPLFKLRYSIGTAGNNPLFNDQYETYLQNAGTERIFKQNMGNNEILPEKVTEQEMGLDMSFRNRFGLELTYVRTHTQNTIRADTISSYTGFDTQQANLGDLQAQTYEATFEAQWINRTNFRWYSTLVADRSRNRITNYPRRCAPVATFRRECEGYVFGELYGASFATDARQLSPRHIASNSLDQFDVNDDGLLVAVGPNGSWTDGRWGTNVVVDGITYQWGMPIVQGVYGPTDSLRIGNAITNMGQSLPTFQFGLANDLVWNKWNMHIQFTGQVGGLLYNQTREDLYDLELHAEVDQSGKPEHAKKPSVYYTNQVVAASGSAGLSPDIRVNWFAEDGDYLKISELQLRYRFDRLPRALSQFGMKQGSIALTGRNLYSFTSYTGYDPEAGTANSRVDNLGYPRYRTYSAKLQLTF
jgi:TonB-linked SusC/RagA family outer membrane protein